VGTSLSVETFPEREYGDITLPAGDYTTLRVTIGSGKGANWWCVMFPPLRTFQAVSSVVLDFLKPKSKVNLAPLVTETLIENPDEGEEL
jgi:stage II sporulation protein R